MIKSGNNYNWTGKKILLVEDDAISVELFQIMLRPTHCNLETVVCGNELKKRYGTLNSYDCVLLDIRLPDACGWDLAREIKSLSCHLPIIAQTAYDTLTALQECIEAGCDSFLTKPIERVEFLATLAKYMHVGNNEVSTISLLNPVAS